MPVTVNANGLSIVHQGSGGIAVATAPDVCKTPSPNGPVPMPYPNIAYSADLVGGSTTVKIDGCPAAIQGSKIAKSTGDEAGSAGGVVSNVFIGEATFISFSPTVMIEGKPVCRLTDKMLMNKANTVCMGGWLQTPVVAEPLLYSEDVTCKVPPTEAPKRCVIKKFQVNCGHTNPGLKDKDRKLKLDLCKLRAKDNHILEVVCKEPTKEKDNLAKADDVNKHDTLVIQWEGECGYKHKESPSLVVIRPERLRKGDETPGMMITAKRSEIELFPPLTVPVFDVIKIVRTLFSQTDYNCDYYSIYGITCNGPDTVNNSGQWLQLRVYPEISIKGKFFFDYSKQVVYDRINKVALNPSYASVDLGMSIDAVYGSNKYSFRADLPVFSDTIRKLGETTELINQFMAQAMAGAVKLSVIYPKWTTEIDLSLVELKGKPRVGVEGIFRIAFEPLIGLEGSVSILGALIALTSTPVSAALTRFRDLAKKPGNATLDIDIVLTAHGKVGGEIKVACKQGKITPSGSITTGLGFSAKGFAKVSMKFFIAKATGIVEFGTQAAQVADAARGQGKKPSEFKGTLSPSKNSKDPFAIEGKIEFTGLAFYFLLYGEVSVGGGETKSGQASEGKGHGRQYGNPSPSVKEGVERNTTLYVLFKPATLWPTG